MVADPLWGTPREPQIEQASLVNRTRCGRRANRRPIASAVDLSSLARNCYLPSQQQRLADPDRPSFLRVFLDQEDLPWNIAGRPLRRTLLDT